jgi:hypothetical protein
MNAREAFRSRTFARDRRMWMVTLCLVAIAWVGTDVWLNRHVRLANRRPAVSAADTRFVVLAYDRVVFRADGRSLDGVRLREQLRAIAAAGWQPVTLAEVQNALRGLAPLPARPLLLTFDEGYLGTYEFADPVLRELHWPAVMFLRTDRQESRDVSFLFWDRLRRMRQSGLWEIASGDPPEAATPAAPAAFPSEPPGVGLIAERLGVRAIAAWAPRGLDPLTTLGHPDGGPACAGRDCAPWLGFADDGIGANDAGTSPFRIARLRVHSTWSTPELLSRLELAVGDPASSRTQAIVEGRGAPEDAGGEMRLEGSPRAEAWFPAARWADDWALELSLRVDRGEFWIVQPSGAPGHEWRFGGSGPRLYVQTRSPGRPPDVLASAFAGVRGPAFHKVRVVKRGGGLVVLWDGRALFSSPVAIPLRSRGKVGLVAYRADGPAELMARGASLAPIPYRFLAAPTSPGAAQIAGWVREVESIAALCPAWARVEGDAVRETPVDTDLFRILSRRYAWDVIPEIDVHGGTPPGDATARWLEELPGRVAEEGWAGVRLDLRGVSGAASPAWTDAARALNAALRRDGKRLVTSTR